MFACMYLSTFNLCDILFYVICDILNTIVT